MSDLIISLKDEEVELHNTYSFAKWYDVISDLVTNPFSEFYIVNITEYEIDVILQKVFSVNYYKDNNIIMKKWTECINLEFEFTQERLDILEKHLAIKLLQK